MRKLYHETATQAAERYIKECRDCAALFPALREVILSFDGKMYNKRFETALQAKISRIYCEKKLGSDNFYLSIYHYTESGEFVTLLWCKLPENKRMCADDLIQAAADKRAELLKEAAHMEQIIPTIDTRQKQIEILKRQFEAVTADLSYTEKDIFNMSYHIRNY